MFSEERKTQKKGALSNEEIMKFRIWETVLNEREK